MGTKPSMFSCGAMTVSQRALTPEQLELLRSVVGAAAPELLPRLGIPLDLTLSEIDDICELLGLELARTGFKVGWEPNERGYALETLLDIVNHPRLFPPK